MKSITPEPAVSLTLSSALVSKVYRTCPPASCSSTSAPPTSRPRRAVRRYLARVPLGPARHRHQRRSVVRCCSTSSSCRRARRRARTPTGRSGTRARLAAAAITRRISRPASQQQARRRLAGRARDALRQAVDRERRSTRCAARRRSRSSCCRCIPQYASSSTGTAVARVMELASARWDVPPLDFVPGVLRRPGLSRRVRRGRAAGARRRAARPRAVLVSRPARAADPEERSDAARTASRATTCCDTLGPANRDCYRAQCYATARALAARLGARGELHRLLPVAARPHAVDPAAHRRRCSTSSRSRARSGSRCSARRSSPTASRRSRRSASARASSSRPRAARS